MDSRQKRCTGSHEQAWSRHRHLAAQEARLLARLGAGSAAPSGTPCAASATASPPGPAPAAPPRVVPRNHSVTDPEREGASSSVGRQPQGLQATWRGQHRAVILCAFIPAVRLARFMRRETLVDRCLDSPAPFAIWFASHIGSPRSPAVLHRNRLSKAEGADLLASCDFPVACQTCIGNRRYGHKSRSHPYRSEKYRVGPMPSQWPPWPSASR
jgi:hypothetical protein